MGWGWRGLLFTQDEVGALGNAIGGRGELTGGDAG